MVSFETAEENVEFYVATMVLGLLQGIKNKTVPPDIGIWSLGRPMFWKSLEKKKIISSELLTVLQTLDELDLMENMLPLDMTKELDKLIDTVNICLSKIDYDSIDAKIRPNL